MKTNCLLKEDNELNDEQLASVSGGFIEHDSLPRCPKCGSTNVIVGHSVPTVKLAHCECQDCHHRFFISNK